MNSNLCISCNSSTDYIYRYREQQQLNEYQQDSWKSREEQWLLLQQLIFQPDPRRIVDILT